MHLHSQLFRFQNNRPYPLYCTNIETDDDDLHTVGQVRLYRCRNGLGNDTLLVKILPGNPDAFVAEDFWVENWKRLVK
jgi:hypothetical protein